DRHLNSPTVFLYNEPAPTPIYTLSLHDALPIFGMQTIENLQRTLGRLVVKERLEQKGVNPGLVDWAQIRIALDQKKISHGRTTRSEEHTSELQSRSDLVCRLLLEKKNS